MTVGVRLLVVYVADHVVVVGVVHLAIGYGSKFKIEERTAWPATLIN